MDYQKIDAALAGELDRASTEASINVFIHAVAPLESAQLGELAANGVTGQPGNQILTAAVSPKALSKLSELPWIAHISLATKKRWPL